MVKFVWGTMAVPDTTNPVIEAPGNGPKLKLPIKVAPGAELVAGELNVMSTVWAAAGPEPSASAISAAAACR